jgi:hypothetical protein
VKCCKRCYSYAINHHNHGRDGSGEELCDVCYWRNIAETRLQKINQLEKAGDELLEWLTIDGVSLSNQRLLANQWYRAKGVKNELIRKKVQKSSRQSSKNERH